MIGNLQPGQIGKKSWAEVFKDKPGAEQDFVDVLNERGRHTGMQELSPNKVRGFKSTYVGVDWCGNPVVHAAYKYDDPQDMWGGESTGVLRSICTVSFPKKGLARWITSHVLWDMKASALVNVRARSENPISIHMLETFGLGVIGVDPDGVSVLFCPVVDLILPDATDTFRIELPTFTDGGKYD